LVFGELLLLLLSGLQAFGAGGEQAHRRLLFHRCQFHQGLQSIRTFARHYLASPPSICCNCRTDSANATLSRNPWRRNARICGSMRIASSVSGSAPATYAPTEISSRLC